jgi:hypothetical protein
MGFSSLDDLISESTVAGKTYRQDWIKNYSGGVVVAGRWYDMTYFGGNPAAYTHGNMVYNGNFDGGAGGWTLSSANVAWTAATQLLTKTGAGAETISQNTDCVNGVSYSVVYTIAGYTGSGNIVVSLGGTNGTARTTNGTFRENIVCGATANAPLVVSIPGTVSSVTIDSIAVTRDLGFTPYSGDGIGREAGFWHGGDVSPDTKHMLNIGAWTQAAAGAPAVIQIVDMLGCYPRIPTNLATSQTLNNSLSLPRYTNGNGVRAYFAINTTNGANAQNFTMSYTNTTPTSGRTLGAAVANTASAIQSHIGHSGTAAGNFGPFLPLAGGDAGLRSVQSCQFSAASASAGFVDLVLCKPIVSIPLTTAFVASERNLLSQLFSLPQIQDGAVLGILIQSGAVISAGTQFQGYCDFAFG